MARTNAETRKFEARLREEIARALHAVKAYDLPSVCNELGLAEGTGEEAFSSKFSYVKRRIEKHSETALLELARKVLDRLDDPAPGLVDLVDEYAVSAGERISELTRRKVLKALDHLEVLYGDLGNGVLLERLELLAPMWSKPSVTGYALCSLSDDVEQHYFRNPDWTNADLLENCGALTCTQARFISFLESLLRPEARSAEAQLSLANSLEMVLSVDGYCVRPTSYVSGCPIYTVVRRTDGVHGSAKNLIFASIGPKPELVFRDAVNNDVEIVKHADLCLIYERPLSSAHGLSWLTLVEWWRDLSDTSIDILEARKSFGERLLQSIPANSPGEQAIFRSYFKSFAERLGDKLPALIPQVYLHYDPLTQRERGEEKLLTRQRMDFLMLLPNNVRVVIEVDGKDHYSIDGRASPPRYAEMMFEDRRLRLCGYELYRFGAAEFDDASPLSPHGTQTVGEKSRLVIEQFFTALFKRHRIL